MRVYNFNNNYHFIIRNFNIYYKFRLYERVQKSQRTIIIIAFLIVKTLFIKCFLNYQSENQLYFILISIYTISQLSFYILRIINYNKILYFHFPTIFSQL